MSNNLLQCVQSHINDELIDLGASFLGENSNQTKSAFEVIMPSILAGMISKVSTEESANRLYETFAEAKLKTEDFKNLKVFFEGGTTTNALLNSGNTIIDAVFDNKVGNIIDLVVSQCGIKRSSSSSLLKLSALMMIVLIQKEFKTAAVNSSTLANFLLDQKQNLHAVAPRGLDSALGLKSLDDIGGLSIENNLDKAQSSLHKLENDSFASNMFNSMFGKLIPFFLLLILAYLAYYLLKDRGEELKNIADKTTISKIETEEKEKEHEVGKLKTVKLPNGEKMLVMEGDINDKMVSFLEDEDRDLLTIFTLDQIDFDLERASLRPQSIPAIKNLATILRAYSDAEITIVGHSFEGGDYSELKQISLKRANAVLDKLVELGVDRDRISTTNSKSFRSLRSEDKTKNGRIDVKFEAV